MKKQVEIFLNDQKIGNDILQERDLEIKKLSENINSHNSQRLLMEDELCSLENNQVTLKSKITKLQEDLKNNEAIIITLGNQLSEFSKSSINCRVSHESIQIPTCSMTTDDALEFVNSPVTSGFSHKLSGDNELNKKGYGEVITRR